MVRRNLTSEPGAPSPALVQTAPTPGRATPSAQDKAIDEPPIAFPEYGHIAHSAFGAIARANLPEPQRDHGMVADDFRRSEEHTSELQSLMRNSYAVFCLQKKT